MRFNSVRLAVVVLLALGLLTTIQLPAYAGWQSLSNGFLPSYTDATLVRFTPDSKHVVYLADADTDASYELYISDVSGGGPRKLNAPLVAGGDVQSYVFAPDSSFILYRADQDVDERVDLYKVSLNGGTPVRVNPVLVAGGNIGASVAIDPDSQRIIYLADQQTNDVNELWSVPIAGGSATKLSGSLTSGGNVGTFQVDSIGGRVVFSADATTDGKYELFSTPIAGGSRIQISEPLTLQGAGDTGLYSEFKVHPILPVVVYSEYRTGDASENVFMRPTAGGSVTQISFSLTNMQRIVNFDISPAGDRVVFNVGTRVGGSYPSRGKLHSNLIGAGGLADVSDSADPDYGVRSFQFTPDGSRVIYNFQKNPATPDRLESVTPTGASRTTLYSPQSGETPAYGVTLSNNSQWVLYYTDGSAVNSKTYTVPVGGGSTVNFGRGYSPVLFPDSSLLVYLFYNTAGTGSELYSAQIFGGGVRDLTKLDFAGYASGPQVSPDSTSILFLYFSQEGRVDIRLSDGEIPLPTPTASPTSSPTASPTPVPTGSPIYQQGLPQASVNRDLFR